MSSEEKKKVLNMVEAGRINADQAMTLMKALEVDQAGDALPVLPAAPNSAFGRYSAPEFEEVAHRARRLWQIPLWIGIGLTILSSYWLYTFVHASNFGFWFYCAWTPFLLGVLILALWAATRTSRWLFVNVDRMRAADWPHNITIGLPLPLGLVSWFLRNFGHNINGLDRTTVDEIVEILSLNTLWREPLIVNVNEGEGGERVQVYLG
jgi:hypothetical protein